MNVRFDKLQITAKIMSMKEVLNKNQCYTNLD